LIAFIGIIKTEKGLSLLTKPKEAFIGIIKTANAPFNLNIYRSAKTLTSSVAKSA